SSASAPSWLLRSARSRTACAGNTGERQRGRLPDRPGDRHRRVRRRGRLRLAALPFHPQGLRQEPMTTSLDPVERFVAFAKSEGVEPAKIDRALSLWQGLEPEARDEQPDDVVPKLDDILGRLDDIQTAVSSLLNRVEERV